jgi:sporulation protein YlmC with PRC-barrel domain
MIKSKVHVNKPIVSSTDGKKLGEIKDLYLDQDMRQIAAVFLGKEGLLSRKTLVIPRSAVLVIGVDVWLVSGSDTVMQQEDLPGLATLTLVGDLHGREVQTDGGTKIGAVEDVILDNEAHVLGFGLGKVYAEGPLAERKAIARDAVVELGNQKEPMTINLTQAEAMVIPSA